MPSPRSSHRRGGHDEKNLRGRAIYEKSSSFHGENPLPTTTLLRRPKTLPDLGPSRNMSVSPMLREGRPKLTKLLLNVTIQGSLGPVQVLVSPELTVADLISAAIRQYLKEGRRPILETTEPDGFDLHYSQFSLESLDRKEKLIELGSRNFFLCQRSIVDGESDGADGGSGATMPSASSCSNQAEKATTKITGFNCLMFMEFLF